MYHVVAFTECIHNEQRFLFTWTILLVFYIFKIRENNFKKNIYIYRLFSISPLALTIGYIKTIGKRVFRKASICFSFVSKLNWKKGTWKGDGESGSNSPFNVNRCDGKWYNEHFLKDLKIDWSIHLLKHSVLWLGFCRMYILISNQSRAKMVFSGQFLSVFLFYFSLLPENVRKPLVFRFQGYKNGTLS